MKYEGKYISVVDIETSHLSPLYGYIVEIGICTLDLNTGKVDIVFDEIIKESEEIDKNAWIFKHSNLKHKDVMRAESLKYYFDKIQKILDKYPITAYNKKFDFSWLRDRRFRIKNPLPCIMIEATNVLKIPNQWGYSDYKYPSVEEAHQYYFKDSGYVESHRAVDDAKHEAWILYKMYLNKEWTPELRKR